MTGKVFSIEEFSTFDGPGIRTTVFMKGCPLRCSWCHNPEGQSSESEPFCPNNSPARTAGEDHTADALAAKLKRNAAILKKTGGGVTFSGGEPLAQAEFVFECIDRLDGLHAAIQTSGFCPGDVMEKALRKADFFLYDLKLMDESRHLEHCGKSNAPVLENYVRLARSGVPFVTRIPLIPTVTDTALNLTKIAEFMAKNNVFYAEMLPYNRAAGSKYKAVGRTYEPRFDESIAPSPHAEIFERAGIKIKLM